MVVLYMILYDSIPVTPDEGPSLETSKLFLYFSGSCIPTNESLFILLALPALAQTQFKYHHILSFTNNNLHPNINPKLK